MAKKRAAPKYLLTARQRTAGELLDPFYVIYSIIKSKQSYSCSIRFLELIAYEKKVLRSKDIPAKVHKNSQMAF